MTLRCSCTHSLPQCFPGPSICHFIRLASLLFGSHDHQCCCGTSRAEATHVHLATHKSPKRAFLDEHMEDLQFYNALLMQLLKVCEKDIAGSIHMPTWNASACRCDLFVSIWCCRNAAWAALAALRSASFFSCSHSKGEYDAQC